MSRKDRFIALMFPRCCVWCYQQGDYICKQCKKELHPHPDRCPFCHRVMMHGATCYDCHLNHRHLAGVMVAFVYTDMIKKLILWLKFGHRYDISWFLAERLAMLVITNPTIKQAQQRNTLIVSYVPAHRRRRLMKKWYNQSYLLAKKVAHILDVPCVSLSKKIRHTASQTRLSRQERLTNLHGSFATRPRYILKTATILLIDDITTTWSTLHELAKEIHQRYPSTTIWWAVIGRHGK